MRDATPDASPEISEIVDAIRQFHRERCYWMEQRKRANLALLSFLKSQLGWRKDGTAEGNAAAAQQTAALIELAEAIEQQQAKIDKRHAKACAKATNGAKPERERRESIEGEDDPLFRKWGPLIHGSIAVRHPFDQYEGGAEKELARLAGQLPVWREFGEGVKGFGVLGLAIIVGEAGDLSNYATHSKLWKRMGLAFMEQDGVRQGGLPKTASAEDWIRHGYNQKRRSRMWNIGDAIIKSAGPYREVYLARKEYERKKAEEAGLIILPSAEIAKLVKKGRKYAEFRSDGHIHRRAQRVMEKKLLRDLWKAWRRATVEVAERPMKALPAAKPIEARPNV